MDYKQKFIDYCKDKLADLGYINIKNEWYDPDEEDGEEEFISRKVDLIGDIREVDNAKAFTREDDSEFMSYSADGNEIYDAMIDEIEYAFRMEFTKIDKEFYNMVLEYWDEFEYYFDESLNESCEDYKGFRIIFNQGKYKFRYFDQEDHKYKWVSCNYINPLKDTIDKWIKEKGIVHDYQDYLDKNNGSDPWLKARNMPMRDRSGNIIESSDESLNEETKSNGIYSLYNGWVKEPVKDDVPADVDLEPELSQLIDKAETCNTIEEIDNFIDDIYKLRQESLLTDGEYGKGNQIFKAIRSKGILHDLKVKKTALENKEMSLENLQEEINEDDVFNSWVQGMADNFEGSDYEDDEQFRQPNGLIKYEATVDSMAGFGSDIIYQKEVASKEEVIKDLEEQGWEIDVLSIYPVHEFTSSEEWAKQFESLNEGHQSIDYKGYNIDWDDDEIEQYGYADYNVYKLPRKYNYEDRAIKWFKSKEEAKKYIDSITKNESLNETLSLDKVVPDALEQMRSRGVENITVDDIAEEIAYEYPGYEDWQDIIANYDDSDAIRRFKDIRAAIIHELPNDFYDVDESLNESKLSNVLFNRKTLVEYYDEMEIDSMLDKKWKSCANADDEIAESAKYELQEESGKERRLATYKKFANLKEDDVITEENLDEKALASTSCRHSFDYNDLKNELLGR